MTWDKFWRFSKTLVTQEDSKRPLKDSENQPLMSSKVHVLNQILALIEIQFCNQTEIKMISGVLRIECSLQFSYQSRKDDLECWSN